MSFGLNRQSIATIGAALAIVVAIAGGTYRITAKIDELTTRIAAVEQSQYSISAAAEQALRMAIANPGLKVPDPRDPSQLIQVRAAQVVQ